MANERRSRLARQVQRRLPSARKRPTSLERKARTAERHRLLVPTRIALVVAVVVLAYFLIWPMIRSLAGS